MDLTTAATVALVVLCNPLVLMLLVSVGEVRLCYWSRRLRRRGEFARSVRVARWAFRIARFEMASSQLVDRLLGWSSAEYHAFAQIRFPSYVGTLCELAESVKASGDLAGAEQLLDDALALATRIGAKEDAGFALLLGARAGAYLAHAAAPEARPLLERALAIQKRLAPAEPEVGHTLNSLGIVHQMMGDYRTAARAYEEACAVYTRAGGAMRENLIQVLNNLGTLALESGDLDRGGQFLREAVERARRVNGDRHPTTAMVLLNLAVWHEKMRQFPESLRLIREVLPIRAELLGTDHPAYTHALNNLAAYLCQTGAVEEARAVADRAMAGRLGIAEDNPLARDILGVRARVAVLDGKPRDALELLRESAQIERRVIGRIFSITSDGQRLSYLASVRKRVFYFLSLVHSHLRHDPQAVGDAFDLVLTRKALAAEAVAAQRDAVLGGRYPELAGKLGELSGIRQRVAAMMLAGPGPEGLDTHRLQLAWWRKRQSALEVELAGAIPEVGLHERLLAADRRAVAAALPVGAALVEFVRFDLFDWLAVPARGDEQWKPARYAAFVLRKEDDGLSMVDLGEADAIDTQIHSFRGELLGGPPDGSRGMVMLDDEPAPAALDAAGAALRQAVFDPLREAIDGAGHLILATDGELATLPFETLPDTDGRPLVESHLFSYLAVGRDLLRSEGPAGPAGPSLVLAGPDFDLGAGSAAPVAAAGTHLSRDFDRAAVRFPPLPGTVAEGREVSAALGVEPALGADAVEARLRECASPQVLHLATHGFFLPDQPGEADRPGGRADALRAGPENPLLRSGLALAGANTWLAGGAPPAPAGDGLLTAEDVAGLDLLNTELVVLSACETGLGEVRAGEGVFGLRRAFQLAGARAVVMSLWKVPDEATRELMVAFYRHLLAGLPRAEALRRAQLELKARYPDPRFWGAFILQGDTRPLPPTPPAGAGRWATPAPAPAKPPTRVVYDILADYRLRPQDAMFLVLPQGLVLGVVLVYLVQLLLGHPNATKKPEVLLAFPILSVTFYGLYYFAHGPWVRSQWRCRRWYEAGDYVTTEGEVSGYESRSAKPPTNTRRPGIPKKTVSFRVGKQAFIIETWSRKGGYRLGDIGMNDDHTTYIWNGERLRVMHHDGRILRIEHLEPEAKPAESASPNYQPGVVYVRVVAPPPWDAPHEICRSWVGMVLPVLGPETKAGSGTPGPKHGGFFRGLLHRIGQSMSTKSDPTRPPTEYEVDAPAALAQVAGDHPWVADWWRDWAPQWIRPGSTLVFPAAVCEVVWDGHAVPSPGLPTMTAPLAVDPTFDPPADRLPEAEVPSFLDHPPPPARRRALSRLALLAWGALVVAGVIDSVWGGTGRGFGVWLLDLAGLIAGVFFGLLIYRAQEKSIARGDMRALIGRTPTGVPRLWVAFLVGTGFLLTGAAISAGMLNRAPPENAPALVKKRYEARQQGPPLLLGPLLIAIGTVANTFGAATLAKTIRRR